MFREMSVVGAASISVVVCAAAVAHSPLSTQLAFFSSGATGGECYIIGHEPCPLNPGECNVFGNKNPETEQSPHFCIWDPEYGESGAVRCKNGTKGSKDYKAYHENNCAPGNGTYEERDPVLDTEGDPIHFICYKLHACHTLCDGPDTEGAYYCKNGPGGGTAASTLQKYTCKDAYNENEEAKTGKCDKK